MKTRKSKDRKSIGRPGSSARAIYRGQKLRFAVMSWQKQMATVGIVAVAGGVVAGLTGVNPLMGIAVGLGLCLATATLLVAPDALKIIAVCIVYAPLTAPLGIFYTKLAQHNITISSGDMVGGALALIVALLLSIWIASRYSRGRVWVTIALVASSVIFPGMLLGMAAPALGLNAARISMVLVLMIRCGGFAWVTGSLGLLFDREKNLEPEVRAASKEDVKALEAWNQRAQAEQDTAEILEAPDKDYTVFHDIKIKGSDHALGHLVLGSSGGALMASVYSKGPLKEEGKGGITLVDVPLDQVVSALMEQRILVAKALHCAQKDFSLVIVIYGVPLYGARKPLAIFTPDDLTLPSGQVILIGPESILDEVAPGLEMWPKIKLRQTIRRAKMKFRPAMAPIATTSREHDTPRLVSLDADGHAIISGKVSDIIPSWVEFGKPVNIRTTLGILNDLRIVGDPTHNGNGNLVVPVCVEEEWTLSQETGKVPESIDYPLASIFPI
jgi:hypothetical protein